MQMMPSHSLGKNQYHKLTHHKAQQLQRQQEMADEVGAVSEVSSRLITHARRSAAHAADASIENEHGDSTELGANALAECTDRVE